MSFKNKKDDQKELPEVFRILMLRLGLTVMNVVAPKDVQKCVYEVLEYFVEFFTKCVSLLITLGNFLIQGSELKNMTEKEALVYCIGLMKKTLADLEKKVAVEDTEEREDSDPEGYVRKPNADAAERKKCTDQESEQESELQLRVKRLEADIHLIKSAMRRNDPSSSSESQQEEGEQGDDEGLKGGEGEDEGLEEDEDEGLEEDEDEDYEQDEDEPSVEDEEHVLCCVLTPEEREENEGYLKECEKVLFCLKSPIYSPWVWRIEPAPGMSIYVENYMDLDIVQERLANRKYLTVAEFGKDVRQIFANYHEYYGVKNKRYPVAKVTMEMFESMYTNIEKRAEPITKKITESLLEATGEAVPQEQDLEKLMYRDVYIPKAEEEDRWLDFHVRYGNQRLYMSIPDTFTVQDFEYVVALQCYLTHHTIRLDGWEKVPTSKTIALSELGLSKKTYLSVQALCQEMRSARQAAKMQKEESSALLEDFEAALKKQKSRVTLREVETVGAVQVENGPLDLSRSAPKRLLQRGVVITSKEPQKYGSSRTGLVRDVNVLSFAFSGPNDMEFQFTLPDYGTIDDIREAVIELLGGPPADIFFNGYSQQGSTRLAHLHFPPGNELYFRRGREKLRYVNLVDTLKKESSSETPVDPNAKTVMIIKPDSRALKPETVVMPKQNVPTSPRTQPPIVGAGYVQISEAVVAKLTEMYNSINRPCVTTVNGNSSVPVEHAHSVGEMKEQHPSKADTLATSNGFKFLVHYGTEVARFVLPKTASVGDLQDTAAFYFNKGSYVFHFKSFPSERSIELAQLNLPPISELYVRDIENKRSFLHYQILQFRQLQMQKEQKYSGKNENAAVKNSTPCKNGADAKEDIPGSKTVPKEKQGGTGPPSDKMNAKAGLGLSEPEPCISLPAAVPVNTVKEMTKGKDTGVLPPSVREDLKNMIDRKQWFVCHALLKEFLVEGTPEHEEFKLIGDKHNRMFAKAVEKGCINLIKLFLDVGLPVDIIVDNEGNTMFFLAVNYKRIDIQDLLLSKNVNLSCKTSWGKTLPHLAAEKGNLGLLQMLIDRGEQYDVSDLHGRTPLFFALREGHLTIVDFLLSMGVNVNAKTATRETPLHIAAEKGYTDVVAALIKRGADINARDIYLRTPLNLAAKNGHTPIVALLLKDEYCDVHCKDMDHCSALDRAKMNGHDLIVEMLVDHI